jgi:hypothetical protein
VHIPGVFGAIIFFIGDEALFFYTFAIAFEAGKTLFFQTEVFLKCTLQRVVFIRVGLRGRFMRVSSHALSLLLTRLLLFMVEIVALRGAVIHALPRRVEIVVLRSVVIHARLR